MNHVGAPTVNAADRLIGKIEEKKSPIVIGLDPRIEHIPQFVVDAHVEDFGCTRKALAKCFVEFNRIIIDAIEHDVAIVKPQVAFYEQLGSCGFEALEETIAHARDCGLIVILDAKRNDIGPTAEAYSRAYLGKLSFGPYQETVLDIDYLTVNPYLGSDGIYPFVDDAKTYDKGIFVLVRTSNPSSEEFQGLRMGEKPLHQHVLEKVAYWGRDLVGSHGYSSLGAVVGAKYAKDFLAAREEYKEIIFLVPGYGAQGGTAKDVIPLFNKDGYGAIISSSRQISHGHASPKVSKSEFIEHVKTSTAQMRSSITEEMKAHGICPWT